jgi:copper chaperone CopZ
MKKIILSIVIFFTAFIGNAQFSSARLTAAGLTCAMCTRAIYNSLEKIPFISKVDTDIKNSSFVIHFKNSASVDPDVLKSAVEDAGFSISKLTLTANFHHVDLSNGGHVNIDGRIFHFLQVKNETVLDGERTLNMVDHKFVGAREFKKFEAAGDYLCLQSGKAEKCCPGSIVSGSRIYHVTL